MAKSKKIGCPFLIGFIILVSLLFVADEIDLKWIAEWRSLSFEEEKFSSDMDFSFKREAVIENEKKQLLCLVRKMNPKVKIVSP